MTDGYYWKSKKNIIYFILKLQLTYNIILVPGVQTCDQTVI